MSKELDDDDCWFIGSCPVCAVQMGFHLINRFPKPKFYCEVCKKYFHMKDFHDIWVEEEFGMMIAEYEKTGEMDLNTLRWLNDRWKQMVKERRGK